MRATAKGVSANDLNDFRKKVGWHRVEADPEETALTRL